MNAKKIENLNALENPLSKQQLKTVIHNILKNKTVNIAFYLERLQFHSNQKSKLNISLCSMVFFWIIHLLFKNNIMSFGSHFVSYGYMEKTTYSIQPLRMMKIRPWTWPPMLFHPVMTTTWRAIMSLIIL